VLPVRAAFVKIALRAPTAFPVGIVLSVLNALQPGMVENSSGHSVLMSITDQNVIAAGVFNIDATKTWLGWAVFQGTNCVGNVELFSTGQRP
jgi:hypothetical protein